MTAPETGALPALLLTAGLGTRLQPLTYLRAKAAVPINGEPLIVRAIRAIRTAGIRDLVLNLHYKPATIAAVVSDGVHLGVRVRYSWEQPVLGSAGGPRHALPLLTDSGSDDFLIVNGDTLSNLDVASLVARHRASNALVTMALIRNPRPDHYGGVSVTADGHVSGFGRGANYPYHFIGFQVARARAFADLDDGVPSESVNTLYPRLMAANPKAIAAHVSNASFLDIGTPADCLQTSLELAERDGANLVGRNATIDETATLIRTVVWDDVSIGAEAVLRDCVIGDGARIPPRTQFEGCAIVPADGRTARAGERIEAGLLVKPL